MHRVVDMSELTVPVVKSPRPHLRRRHTYSPIRCPHCYIRRHYRSNHRGPYDMNWPLPVGAHLLAPFDHQVAGQSSMLRYDESTVCKPLIAREHFVYQTLPEGLKEFTPDYRGELEVGLAEKDGYLQLYGLCVKDDSNEDICQCSLFGNPWEEPPLPDTSQGIEADCQFPPSKDPSELDSQNRCVIRVLRSGSYEICSQTNEDMSTHANSNSHPVKTPSLNPWSLKNHKRLLDKMRKGKHRHNSFRCILLKNVVADFKYPCILDLKIGFRLHGDEALPLKVESQSRKCAETTSNTLGVRLCGMQVYQKGTGQYINLDKFQGRLLTDETFKRTLVHFLHNGIRYRSELLQPIVSKLSNLIKCLRKVDTFRFYASSLLIIYDGLKERTDDEIYPAASHSEVVKSVLSNGDEQSPKLVKRHELQSSTSSFGSDDMDVNSTAWNQKYEMNGHDEMPLDLQKNHNNIESKHSHPSSSPSISCTVKHDGKDSVVDSTAACESICDSNLHVSESESDCGNKSLSNQCSNLFQSQAYSDLKVPVHDQTSEHLSRKKCPTNDHVQTELLNHSSTPSNHKLLDNNSSYHISKVSSHNNTSAQNMCKVDVKMIDFAHTTHRGFPDEPCRHEGPDMDYIQGLTNLMTLFKNLMAEC